MRLLRACVGVAASLVVVAAVGLLYAHDPGAAGSRWPGCPFQALTGLYCAGCGATRAVHALLHGDLGGALAMNPLLVAALPGMAWVWLHERRRSPSTSRVAALAADARAWLVAVVAFGVLRNLPWWPFAWLAPG